MSRSLSTFAAGAFLVLTGCAPRADVAESSRELLKTDQAWAALAAANAPVDSIVAYWTPDARVVLPGQPIVAGTDAIRQMVTGMQAIPGFHISWTPDSAIVSTSGDLGVTYGTNQITMPDSAGAPRTAQGRYIAVWRKESDGRWRCSYDTYNQ